MKKGQTGPTQGSLERPPPLAFHSLGLSAAPCCHHFPSWWRVPQEGPLALGPPELGPTACSLS